MTKEEFNDRAEKLDAMFAKSEALFAQCKAEFEKLKNAKVENGMPTPPHPRRRPIFNENYYYICEIGEVREHIWDEDGQDRALYSAGNVFMSEDAAISAIERMKVLAQMREWAGNWNDSWRIVYTPPFIVPMSVALKNCSAGELRFATQEDAEGCIKAVGKDRLIKYYFGVRDHEIPDETE